MYENQGWTIQMQKLKRTMWQLPSWRQQPRLASIPLFSRGCQRICSQYEEMLRSLDDSDKVNQQSVACATIVYFSSRMEAVSTSLDCWTTVDGLLRCFFRFRRGRKEITPWPSMRRIWSWVKIYFDLAGPFLSTSFRWWSAPHRSTSSRCKHVRN